MTSEKDLYPAYDPGGLKPYTYKIREEQREYVKYMRQERKRLQRLESIVDRRELSLGLAADFLEEITRAYDILEKRCWAAEDKCEILTAKLEALKKTRKKANEA